MKTTAWSPRFKTPRFTRWQAAVLATALLSPAVVTATARPTEASFSDSPKAVLDEAWQIVYREYVDPTFNHTDWVAVRQDLLGQPYRSRQAAYSELRRVLRRLNDPYTRFLDPDQYGELTEQTAGEVSGVGMQFKRDSGKLVITGVVDNSPAAAAGIRPGDHLLLVDGRATNRLSVQAVSQLVRGTEGTQVTLTLGRNGGHQETLILTRAVIEVPSVTYNVREQADMRVGYIRLSEFNAHAAEQMQTAIETLGEEENVEAFVLDLRNNPGGLYQASVEISRMWLRRGQIVRTVYREGESEAITANRTSLTDLPLAVLVNNQSASSSEIVTGALGDNDRAVVVGNPTFGKALVQSLHGLADGSGIAVTVAHYYTPNGTDISRKGIIPDVQVELSDQERRTLLQNPNLLGTEADPQFLEAVEALAPDILARRVESAAPTAVTPMSTPPQLGRTL
ncbi:MAG: S41 family peptidase [Cyanobacteria bacterium P01_A01_bin.105]